MNLLRCEILIAESPVRDDAFVFWMKGYKATHDVLFEFKELYLTLMMIQQNGLIREGKSYISLTYDWNGEEYFLNVSETFDNMNLKYCYYPDYLSNRILYQ